jgi:hypothetical protein
MKKGLCTCLFTLLAAANANAAWEGDGNITDLFGNIDSLQKTADDIQTKLGANGDISITADDLRDQLQRLQSQGLEIKASVADILAWLQARQGPFKTFIGGDLSDRCGPGSPCDWFRSDLKSLVGDLSLLSDRFPAIEKLGVGDGYVMQQIIDRLPPFVLFATYEAMQRMPDWQSIPQMLADIYDEIGDPDAFAIDLAPRSAQTASFSAAASATPTQDFCARKADKLDKEVDPIRLNRIDLTIAYLTKILEVGAEFAPQEAGASLIGEGVYGVPLPFKGWLVMVKNIIELVQASVATYRDNIAICRDKIREIELLVAQCIWIDDFVRPGTGAEVYDVVKGQIDAAGADGVSVVKANSFLNRASTTVQTKDDYQTLCSAYSKIGS